MDRGRRASRAQRAARRVLGALCIAGAVIAHLPAAADDLAAQRAAAHQLVRGQLDSGLLEFDVDFFAGKGFGSGTTSRENTAFIARQAAAAYGLGKYLEQSRDEHVRAPLARLIQAMGDRSQSIDKAAPQRLVESSGILSLPFLRVTLRNTLDRLGLLYQRSGDGALIAYETGYATAWAGTTAMALMAELHYFRATGDDRFAALRARWRRGLDALYVPGGGFREFPDVIEEEPYTNGESWLAYALFAETFPGGPVDPRTMRRIDDYMMSTYSGAHNIYFFHWGAMAASRRYLATGDRRFADFLEDQVRAALDKAPAVERPHNSCALVEGLAAGAAVLARDGRSGSALYRALRARIDAEMEKNRALQLLPGQDRLEAGPDSYLFAPRLKDYAGAYLMGRYTPTIRVDITHHCISAIAEMQ